jgi:hypothetical protein
LDDGSWFDDYGLKVKLHNGERYEERYGERYEEKVGGVSLQGGKCIMQNNESVVIGKIVGDGINLSELQRVKLSHVLAPKREYLCAWAGTKCDKFFERLKGLDKAEAGREAERVANGLYDKASKTYKQIVTVFAKRSVGEMNPLAAECELGRLVSEFHKEYALFSQMRRWIEGPEGVWLRNITNGRETFKWPKDVDSIF